MKKAHFLRGFWNLFHGYWHSEEKWKACGLLGVVISLNFAMVYLVVLINEWYKDFYDALQAYNYELFWPLLGQFTALALFHIVIAVYAIYLQQLLQIRWRTWKGLSTCIRPTEKKHVNSFSQVKEHNHPHHLYPQIIRLQKRKNYLVIKRLH